MKIFLIKLAIIILVGIIITIGYISFTYYMQPGLNWSQVFIGIIGWGILVDPAWKAWTRRIKELFNIKENGQESNY